MRAAGFSGAASIALLCSAVALAACATGEEVSLAGKLPAPRTAARAQQETVVAAPANSGVLLIGGSAVLPGSFQAAGSSAPAYQAADAGVGALGASTQASGAATVVPAVAVQAGPISGGTPISAPERVAPPAPVQPVAAVATQAAGPGLGASVAAGAPPGQALAGAVQVGPPGQGQGAMASGPPATAPGQALAPPGLSVAPGQVANAGVGVSAGVAPSQALSAPGANVNATVHAGHPLGGPPGQATSNGLPGVSPTAVDTAPRGNPNAPGQALLSPSLTGPQGGGASLAVAPSQALLGVVDPAGGPSSGANPGHGGEPPGQAKKLAPTQIQTSVSVVTPLIASDATALLGATAPTALSLSPNPSAPPGQGGDPRGKSPNHVQSGS